MQGQVISSFLFQQRQPRHQGVCVLLPSKEFMSLQPLASLQAGHSKKTTSFTNSMNLQLTDLTFCLTFQSEIMKCFTFFFINVKLNPVFPCSVCKHMLYLLFNALTSCPFLLSNNSNNIITNLQKAKYLHAYYIYGSLTVGDMKGHINAAPSCKIKSCIKKISSPLMCGLFI